MKLAVKKIIAAIFLVLTVTNLSFGQVKFCAVGDVLLDRGVRKTIENNGICYLFDEVQSYIQQHDLAFFNLECPLTNAGSKAPLLKRFSFRGDVDAVAQLRKVGFNIASIANNHTIDWGRVGFAETWNVLTQGGIFPVGGGCNQREAIKPVLLKKNNLTFAFFGSVSFLLEGLAYNDDQWGPAYADIDSLVKEIKAINNFVDYVIVSFHWGDENSPLPNNQQKDYAHKVVDAGADLVIGHHPHVLQSIEVYKDRLILYSLGNFVFDNKSEDQTQTVIFSCLFEKHKISQNRIYPLEIKNNRPQKTNKEKAQEIINSLAKRSKGYGTRLKRISGSSLYSIKNKEKDNGWPTPIKEFSIGEGILKIFSNSIQLWQKGNEVPQSYAIKDKAMKIIDASILTEGKIIYVCTIIDKHKNARGRQIAIFPLDLETGVFKNPILDIHDYYGPWKIRVANVDGKDNPEVIVGVFKKTNQDTVKRNRLFVFNFKEGFIYPKWLGSRLGMPFTDFEVEDYDNDGRDEMLAWVIDEKGIEKAAYYRWNGFGFDEDKTVADSAVTSRIIKLNNISE